LPERFVCATFDDGSDYDWKPVRHPLHGVQEPMADIVRRHRKKLFGILTLRKAFATSFVIASPAARNEIVAADKPYRLSQDWWAEAQASGFFDIGSHGWNHVHPAVREMRECPELTEAFGEFARRRRPSSRSTPRRITSASSRARSPRAFSPTRMAR
jgi:peptidoglycan/xylan/chitin deacetylase (PgdA/CDA1 family)